MQKFCHFTVFLECIDISFRRMLHFIKRMNQLSHFIMIVNRQIFFRKIILCNLSGAVGQHLCRFYDGIDHNTGKKDHEDQNDRCKYTDHDRNTLKFRDFHLIHVVAALHRNLSQADRVILQILLHGIDFI